MFSLKDEIKSTKAVHEKTVRDTNSRSLGYNDLARLVILAGIIIFVIVNMGAFLKILTTLLGVLSPVLIGVLIAFVLNLPLVWFERKVWRGSSKWMRMARRPVSILFSLLILFGLIALLVVLVIPQSIEAIAQISDLLPALMVNLTGWLEGIDIPGLKEMVGRLDPAQLNLAEIFSNTGILAGGLFRGITGVLGGVMNAGLGLGFAIFILAGKEQILHQADMLMTAYLPPQPRAHLKYYISVITDVFSKYIFGQVMEALAMGIITTVGLLLFRFPFATIIGPVTGLSSLIPMIGAFIGGAVGFLLILTVNPVQAVLFIVFIVILQQLDGIFLYPKIVGKSVGLPQLWTFFAVIIGGALFGFTGTFLGVPALAVVYRLLGENTRKRLEEKEKGNSLRYQILTIPKGKEPVRINEPELAALVDPEVDTDDFKP